MEQAKLLSMTVVLTVLIWTSADALIRETATIAVTLDLVSQNPAMFIEPTDPPASCQIEVSGPRRAVEAILAQVPLRARISVADLPTGPNKIPLDRETIKRAITEQQHEFRKLSIDSFRPTTVTAMVDHLVTRSVEITARHLTLDYEIAPHFSHSSVVVRARESVLGARADRGQSLVVDVSGDVDRFFREKPAGAPIETTIKLSVRGLGGEASLDPPNVIVSATLRAQQKTAEIKTVPILLAVSFANFNRRFSPATRDGKPLELISATITVVGPPEEIARLVRGESRTFGVIRLKEDDFQTLGTVKLVTPEFYLPPHVTLASEPRPVEFQLVASNSGSAGP